MQMNAKRILIINESSKYSGLGRYARDLSTATGGELISLRTDRSIPVDRFDGRVINSVFIPGLGNGWYVSHRFPKLFLRRLMKVIDNEDISIVHYSSQGIPHLIETDRTVTTIHDLFSLELASADRSSLLIRRQIEKLDGDNYIITVSNYIKKKLIEKKIKGKIDVIYPAISSAFKPLENKIALRKKLGLPEDKTVILNVSSLDKRKNIPAIIKTKERSDGNFLFVHVGPEIPGFLNFTNVNDALLNEIYNSADVFVFPSLDEGFGSPVLEAMAVGVPVVASDIEIFRETLGDSAILVEPTPENIVNGVKEAINSKDDFISKGLTRSKEYDFQHFKERMEYYYSRII